MQFSKKMQFCLKNAVSTLDRVTDIFWIDVLWDGQFCDQKRNSLLLNYSVLRSPSTEVKPVLSGYSTKLARKKCSFSKKCSFPKKCSFSKKVQFLEMSQLADSPRPSRRTNSKIRASQTLGTWSELAMLSTPHSKAFWRFLNPCSKNHQNTRKKCSFSEKNAVSQKKCSFQDSVDLKTQLKKSP
jgi:hypothetical protein